MTLIKRAFPMFPGLTDFFDDDWLKLSNTDWMPAVNVVENDDSYEIEVAAPGMKKEDFSVNIEGNMLMIVGKAEKEEKEEKKNYTRKEFSFRSFERSFTLPEDVRKEEVDAKYADGMLRIVLKKVHKKALSKKQVSIQ